MTFPRHAGQLPVYYNYKPSKKYWLEKGWGHSYADLDPGPLYPFGHGLSYTSFSYGNLSVVPWKRGGERQYLISADITNTGKTAGTEIAQLYIRDKVSSMVRPVMELRGFERVRLDPGVSGSVHFSLGFEELKMLDRNLNWVVEPGEFEIMIGSSSKDIRLKGSLDVTVSMDVLQ